jgi:hypothetical protein
VLGRGRRSWRSGCARLREQRLDESAGDRERAPVAHAASDQPHESALLIDERPAGAVVLHREVGRDAWLAVRVGKREHRARSERTVVERRQDRLSDHERVRVTRLDHGRTRGRSSFELEQREIVLGVLEQDVRVARRAARQLDRHAGDRAFDDVMRRHDPAGASDDHARAVTVLHHDVHDAATHRALDVDRGAPMTRLRQRARRRAAYEHHREHVDARAHRRHGPTAPATERASATCYTARPHDQARRDRQAARRADPLLRGVRGGEPR